MLTKQAIQAHIHTLEQTQAIQVLMAVESGSRAWGCPSIDSDYDVRVIYVRPRNWYLSIDQKKEEISYFEGKWLDVSGWDIKKTLQLLRKSNATPFEWLQSPIVYAVNNNFKAKFEDLMHTFFEPQAMLGHYRGLAKNSYYSGKKDNTMKLKKLFYVIRPLLAAKWIITKQSIPPMDLPSLLPIITTPHIRQHLIALLEHKTMVDESYIHTLEPMLQNFIETELALINIVIPKRHKTRPSTDLLDQFFRDILNNGD